MFYLSAGMVTSSRATLLQFVCSVALESAAHGAIMDCHMSRNLTKPVAMPVCLGYHSVFAFASIRFSDGLAALNCTRGISSKSFGDCVLFNKTVAT